MAVLSSELVELRKYFHQVMGEVVRADQPVVWVGKRHLTALQALEDYSRRYGGLYSEVEWMIGRLREKQKMWISRFDPKPPWETHTLGMGCRLTGCQPRCVFAPDHENIVPGFTMLCRDLRSPEQFEDAFEYLIERSASDSDALRRGSVELVEAIDRELFGKSPETSYHRRLTDLKRRIGREVFGMTGSYLRDLQRDLTKDSLVNVQNKIKETEECLGHLKETEKKLLNRPKDDYPVGSYLIAEGEGVSRTFYKQRDDLRGWFVTSRFTDFGMGPYVSFDEIIELLEDPNWKVYRVESMIEENGQ